jgi:hypothetical protein
MPSTRGAATMPVIRISDDVFAFLQSHAVPLSDTPDQSCAAYSTSIPARLVDRQASPRGRRESSSPC